MLGRQGQGHGYHKLEEETANNEYQKPGDALHFPFSLKKH